jgi:hypothetical protein
VPVTALAASLNDIVRILTDERRDELTSIAIDINNRDSFALVLAALRRDPQVL